MFTKLTRAVLIRSASTTALALIGAATVSPIATAQQAQPPRPAQAKAPAPADEDDVDTVTITGERQPPYGSVPGNPTPEFVISPLEVRSYGASNIDELLESLAPELGTSSGRGSGGPVVLLNGRRVSGMNEINTLPTEAIQRVEVFTEEVSLQYGYSPDQRVVNIVLRRRFRANTVEANAGQTANGEGDQGSLQVGDLTLSPKGRVNLDGKINGSDAVTRLERGVDPPVAGVDDRDARTVIPETEAINVTGVWNHVLDRTWAITSSTTLQNNQSQSKAGFDPVSGDVIHSEQHNTDARLGFTVDGQTQNWMLTGTLTADRSESNNKIMSTMGSTSNNINSTYELMANATGTLFEAPAGKARLSLRGSFNDATLDGESVRAGVPQSSSLHRQDLGGRATLNVPLTSTRNGILPQLGNISAFVSGSVDAPSDYDTVTSYGGGFTWAPLTTLHFTLRGNNAEAAPNLTQLGGATVVTPGVQVFDQTTGQTVFVTMTTGGNPNLQVEHRQDVSLTGSWAVLPNLTFSGSYTHNETRNAPTAFPAFTPTLEAAFPLRFTRDASGALIAVDRRAINTPDREGETARIGLTFSQGFGPKIERPQGGVAGALQGLRARRANGGAAQPGVAPAPAGQKAGEEGKPVEAENQPPRVEVQGQEREGGPPPGPPPDDFDGPPPGADGPPPGGGRGFGGGPGGGGPGFGGGGGGGRGFGGGRGGGGPRTPPQVGRVSLSVFYTRRIEDTVVLAPGLQPIDLLEGAALGGDGGGGRDKIEFEGGVIWQGMGLRLNGSWSGGYDVPGATPAQDLSYGGVTSLDARAFLDFNAYPELVRAHPILRSTRLVLRISNVLDSAPRVRDGTGEIPYAYQHDLLAPRGVSWQIGIRKLFQ